MATQCSLQVFPHFSGPHCCLLEEVDQWGHSVFGRAMWVYQGSPYMWRLSAFVSNLQIQVVPGDYQALGGQAGLATKTLSFSPLVGATPLADHGLVVKSHWQE